MVDKKRKRSLSDAVAEPSLDDPIRKAAQSLSPRRRQLPPSPPSTASPTSPQEGQRVHAFPHVNSAPGPSLTSVPASTTSPSAARCDICEHSASRSPEADRPPSFAGTIDNDTLPSPPELVRMLYDADFGEKVCAAYELKTRLDNFVYRLRVRKYGETVANEYPEGQTPHEIRDEYNRVQDEAVRRHEAEGGETSDEEGDP